MEKVSVFIPFNNEEGNIKELVERVEQGGENAGVEIELIMVDDGSNDGSKKEAEELARDREWFTLIRHRVNRGLTEAMKSGFAACSGDVIIFLPSDLESHPDEDIPALLSGFTPDVHVVCGRRQGRKDGKLVLSNIYNIISNHLFGLDLHDMNWIKAFRCECLEDLELRSDWHRFIVQILHEKGYRAVEVPVTWHKRRHGKSHFGFKRIPIAFFDALAVKFILKFTKAPMRFFGSIGALQMFLASAIIAYLLYSTFILGEVLFKVRPIMYFIVILFLSGLIFFFMGFIAELVVSVKDEIKEREK